jgi:hypothetical protein
VIAIGEDENPAESVVGDVQAPVAAGGERFHIRNERHGKRGGVVEDTVLVRIQGVPVSVQVADFKDPLRRAAVVGDGIAPVRPPHECVRRRELRSPGRCVVEDPDLALVVGVPISIRVPQGQDRVLRAAVEEEERVRWPSRHVRGRRQVRSRARVIVVHQDLAEDLRLDEPGAVEVREPNDPVAVRITDVERAGQAGCPQRPDRGKACE